MFIAHLCSTCHTLLPPPADWERASASRSLLLGSSLFTLDIKICLCSVNLGNSGVQIWKCTRSKAYLFSKRRYRERCRPGWPWGAQGSPPSGAAPLPLVCGHWAQLCGAVVQAPAVSLDRLTRAVTLSRQGVFVRAAEIVLFGSWLW